HGSRQDARALARPDRRLLRQARRLDDPRGDLSYGWTERRRTVAGREETLRRGDVVGPALGLGDHGSGTSVGDGTVRPRRRPPPRRPAVLPALRLARRR